MPETALRDTEPQIERWARADPLLHGRLNETVDAVNRIRRTLGGGQVNRGAIPDEAPADVGIELGVFEVQTITRDYLDCKRFINDVLDTTIVSVMKPYRLAEVNWGTIGGVSLTFEANQRAAATDGATNETWKVTPVYVVGDIILAIQTDTDTFVDNAGGERIVWCDLNTDGRAWAKV